MSRDLESGEKPGKSRCRKGFWFQGPAGGRVPSWTCRDRRSSQPRERRLQSSKESLASAQGPVRGRRVCSFIGVGYLGLFGLWLMEGLQEKNSGAKFNSPGRSLRLGTERVGKESRPEMEMTRKESLILLPRRKGRRRRVKRPLRAGVFA